MAKLFAPILAGAELRDRLVACVGIGVALVIVGVQGAVVHGHGVGAPWIVAPMGASAVLLFAVPTSPMAQPWPIIGGTGLSALIGVAAGRAFGHGALSGGLAVALAIGLMSITRSLHPPGGAAALTAALGPTDWLFPLAPVAMNAAVLVLLGWSFHRMRGHAYPHRSPAPVAPASWPIAVDDADVDAVLADLGETFDISREDLRELVRRLELQALARLGSAST